MAGYCGYCNELLGCKQLRISGLDDCWFLKMELVAMLCLSDVHEMNADGSSPRDEF